MKFTEYFRQLHLISHFPQQNEPDDRLRRKKGAFRRQTCGASFERTKSNNIKNFSYLLDFHVNISYICNRNSK